MTARSELHGILGDVLSGFAAIYILHNNPLMPLTLAHTRDPSYAVATSMAGAPTKTPVQGCLAIYVHIYRSLQQSGINAYLLH